MSFLPQYQNDLFISYRRAANDSPDRWVDSFCNHLRSELRDRVGEVAIWRDTAELRAGDYWRPEIAAALESTGIFLALISRTYFDSDECRKELDRFLGRLKAAGGAERCKLVPIFKHPSRSPDELPAELREIGHYEFFKQDAQAWRELDPNRDKDDYWERMSRMVQDLSVALEELLGRQKKQALGTVFIARVGPELLQERERLRADLRQRGYLVVPETEYLWNADDCAARMDADLDKALLSIHLVARSASIEPLTAQRDRLQLERAHARMRQRGMPAPLVWIQAGSGTGSGTGSDTDPSKQDLLKFIEQELANEGVDYLRGSLEELKTQMLDMLPKPIAAAPSKPLELALLVEEGDVAALGELKGRLVDQMGAEPRPIKFSGSKAKDAERLQRTLAGCEQALIFWGQQEEEWVYDMLDLPDLERLCSKNRLAVYICGAPSAEKAAFVSSKATVLRAQAAGEDGLAAFLAQAQTLGRTRQ
ncbi:toll/interleukin-1 receptor domain-containing protein [Roseateles sp. PN1]|uniref:toll/interleukin-1 receptor domain-containing protein n=1 Tax=Roseateles sp. PN1 TaxID=3137372 RepID=UPI003138D1C0